jgi:hypothetical protein
MNEQEIREIMARTGCSRNQVETYAKESPKQELKKEQKKEVKKKK